MRRPYLGGWNRDFALRETQTEAGLRLLHVCVFLKALWWTAGRACKCQQAWVSLEGFGFDKVGFNQ